MRLGLYKNAFVAVLQRLNYKRYIKLSSMAQKPHEILQIKPNADGNEIRKAWFKAIRTAHPDRESGSHERFIEVHKAYHTMNDALIQSRTGKQSGKKKTEKEFEEDVRKRAEATANNLEKAARQKAKAANRLDEDGPMLDDFDPEIEDLLDWWSKDDLPGSDVKACLRIDEDNFVDQLLEVFRQYRLTYPLSPLDEEEKASTDENDDIDSRSRNVAQREFAIF